MTERRRFFPSRPVQQAPGKSVELALQLRPAVASTTVASGTTDPTPVEGARCTGWINTDMHGLPFDAFTVADLGGGLYEFEGGYSASTSTDCSGLVSALWSGTPSVSYGPTTPRPVPSDTFACTALVIETTYSKHVPGRAVMSFAPGCTWQIAWDSPDPGDDFSSGEVGHYVLVFGETLMVNLLNTGTGESNLDEVLTATAISGGDVIATLVLTARRVSY